ncbi:hypothetical protein [Sporomusa acidovorans]|uniref:FAD:protein FMN transferase n=1 Tax=Sporomusa acidovorans (strain ATCC 49682 / DSM 3132 / Mol) TaxID=1123286 RepID=A0ABZ3J336_SPOA4|nr:hypothetical protein [Sporomusa acidovorans]OZC19972.1 hypothetical protein SPACI_23690 [Sporomusa acidovorans DSM 3132]SDD48756.1 hypothetical protein SAMN04488499_1001422 [Sporomusa acidovorans]
MIETLKSNLVKLDYGPIQMTIQASCHGQPLIKQQRVAAREAMRLLDELAKHKHIAALPQAEVGDISELPAILQKMVAAVRESGDETLTPMAAVAGSFADLVADYLVAQGATKVIINNGGDIAVRLRNNESVAVGLAPALAAPFTHVKQITAQDGIGGITTSGLGGRSFTKGIATAAVVAAGSAAFADACATSLGNATYAPHPNIQRVLAETLDPNIDIKGHYVVASVGALPQEIIEKSLRNGWQKAQAWLSRGQIKGAAIFINHYGVFIPNDFAQPAERTTIGEVNHGTEKLSGLLSLRITDDPHAFRRSNWCNTY